MKAMPAQAIKTQATKPLTKRPVFWLPLSLLAMYLLYRLLNVYLFPIEKLYITGQVDHIKPLQVKQVAMENVSYGFFAVDLNALRSALEELRWVQNVSIRRVWPNALQIDIQEHKAVARWGQIYLINERGNLFIPDDLEQGEGLPSLIGPPGMHRFLWGQYSELQSMLNGTGLQIAQLVFDSRHAMRLKTQSGISIQLGRLRNVTDSYVELTLFAKAYRQRLLDKQANIASIDLRYTNGFAIEWRGHRAAADSSSTDANQGLPSIQQRKHLT